MTRMRGSSLMISSGTAVAVTCEVFEQPVGLQLGDPQRLARGERTLRGRARAGRRARSAR